MTQMTQATESEISDSRITHRILMFLASGLGAGYSPIASGTVATAVAIPIYFAAFHPLNHLNLLHAGIYLVLLAFLFLLGVYVSTKAELALKEKDPHYVTIDEIAGFMMTMFLVPFSSKSIIAGFFLFRLFDVWKPYPIRQIQILRGGWGVMIDDMLAGLYSCICLQILFRVFPL